jgi:hypothetical protein
VENLWFFPVKIEMNVNEGTAWFSLSCDLSDPRNSDTGFSLVITPFYGHKIIKWKENLSWMQINLIEK